MQRSRDSAQRREQVKNQTVGTRYRERRVTSIERYVNMAQRKDEQATVVERMSRWQRHQF